MKKAVAVLLTLALLLGSAAFASEEAEAPFYTRMYDLFTFRNIESSQKWPLFFRDGADDMPWIDLEELADMANFLENEVYGNKGFHLFSYYQNGSVISLEREDTGLNMAVDFEESTITFGDYDGFVQKPGMGSLLDLLDYAYFNSEGEAELFRRDLKASYTRYGAVRIMDLSDYGIRLILDDDRGYIPLQTANDFLFTPLMNRSFLFNGESLFFANHNDLWDDKTEAYTSLGSLYYSVKPTPRSQALADFGYNELCLLLDFEYGLKAKHGINSFARTFWEIGYDEPLSSTDPADADLALRSFINYYLDDLHSAFGQPSWMTGVDAAAQFPEEDGPSSRLFTAKARQYYAARSKLLGEKVADYQEVGNTAYVTFDEFTCLFESGDYFAATAEGTRKNDTIGLIAYAHQQITRENSPIENVVIDLSGNIGGDADAALFVISWILGEAEVSVEDPSTGAQATMVYQADVNLDHQFDGEDTLQGRHVYCLISPVSFSCGNLVPAACKASQMVTLIGRASGGGACVVRSSSTAWGTTFQMSGNSRLSFRKNGSFYDIDEGVEPDVYISRIETFYDRQKLTDLINSMP